MPATTHRKRSSVNDVAQLAGVSVGTVSNVLNRPDRVAPGTRQRVLDAINSLSFVPNGSARKLRAGTITTVAAVVLDIGNPFFTEVGRGIEDRLAHDDYTLMLASSDEDPKREARYLRLFEEHGVQGVLVVPSTQEIDHLVDLRNRGVNVVLLDRTSPVPEISSVTVDDIGGGELATQHLIDQGHTRIALLNGPHTIGHCIDRREGMQRAMIKAGLDPERDLVEVFVPTMNADGGTAGAQRLLQEYAHDLPSALFCVNDITALGALRALRREGVRVPHDMAVVGYDDVPFAAELAVPLTSVSQPTYQLGLRAADLLLNEGRRESGFQAEQIEFEPELVIRESSLRV